MSRPIGPLWWQRVGQKVVCVDDCPSAGKPYCALTKGEVYTISAVTHSGRGLWLFEIEPPLGHSGFKAYRFRPVRETNIEQFRAMLNPTPELEPAS